MSEQKVDPNTDKEIAVELAKLHMVIVENGKRISKLEEPIGELYRKVISGNGDGALLTRMEVAENSIKNLVESHKACKAPEKVGILHDKVNSMENKATLESDRIEREMQDLSKTLDLITDDDVYKRRKIWSTIMDGIKMLVVALMASILTFGFSKMGILNKNSEEHSETQDTYYERME